MSTHNIDFKPHYLMSTYNICFKLHYLMSTHNIYFRGGKFKILASILSGAKNIVDRAG